MMIFVGALVRKEVWDFVLLIVSPTHFQIFQWLLFALR
jgi:hypothetical protein